MFTSSEYLSPCFHQLPMTSLIGGVVDIDNSIDRSRIKEDSMDMAIADSTRISVV